MVELIGQVPSTIVLVDHALSRAVDKGAIGQIVVAGEANPEIFEDLSATPDGDAGPDEAGDQAAGEAVSIVAGAWTAQDMGAADEFSESEDPADYSVNTLTVKVGTTVTWSNDDPGQMHTVTDVDGAFDSGFMETGDTWSHTFAEAGEFEYYCLPHPWMRAKIIVEG